MVWVVTVYGWDEQTSRSVTLPRVPTTVPVRSLVRSVSPPVRSPMRPKLGDCCCSADGPSASPVVVSLEVQPTPTVSSKAKPSIEELRSNRMEPLRAEGEYVRRYRDPTTGRRSEPTPPWTWLGGG